MILMYNESKLGVCVFDAVPRFLVSRRIKSYHHPLVNSSPPPITSPPYIISLYTQELKQYWALPCHHYSFICWSRRLVVACFCCCCCLLLRVIFTYQGEGELGQCDPYRNASLSHFPFLSCFASSLHTHIPVYDMPSHTLSILILCCALILFTCTVYATSFSQPRPPTNLTAPIDADLVHPWTHQVDRHSQWAADLEFIA